MSKNPTQSKDDIGTCLSASSCKLSDEVLQEYFDYRSEISNVKGIWMESERIGGKTTTGKACLCKLLKIDFPEWFYLKTYFGNNDVLKQWIYKTKNNL